VISLGLRPRSLDYSDMLSLLQELIESQNGAEQASLMLL
jgi:hypothetical protein